MMIWFFILTVLMARTNNNVFHLEKILLTNEISKAICKKYNTHQEEIINNIFIYIFLKYFLHITDTQMQKENPQYNRDNIIDHIFFISNKLSYLVSNFFLKNKIKIPVNDLNVYEYCCIKGKYKKHKTINWWQNLQKKFQNTNTFPKDNNVISCNYEIKLLNNKMANTIIIDEESQEFSIVISGNQMRDFQILYDIEILQFDTEMDAVNNLKFIKNSMHINRNIIQNILNNKNISLHIFYQCLEFSKLEVHLQNILINENINEPFVFNNYIFVIKKKIFHKYISHTISSDLHHQIVNILLVAMKKKYNTHKLLKILEKI